MKRTVLTALASAVALGALALFAGRPATGGAGGDLTYASGTLKVLTLPMEGPTAGKLYFEIVPDDPGTPSSFKVDASNQAAIAILTSAKGAKAKIRVTYKPDFTVTELEYL